MEAECSEMLMAELPFLAVDRGMSSGSCRTVSRVQAPLPCTAADAGRGD